MVAVPSLKIMILSQESSRMDCEKNISFISLPINSTHLNQPLDAAFFRLLEQRAEHCFATGKSLLLGGVRGTTIKFAFPRFLAKLV